SKPITVDQKLIEGPNPNDRGKFFVPLILAFQVSFVYYAILNLMDEISSGKLKQSICALYFSILSWLRGFNGQLSKTLKTNLSHFGSFATRGWQIANSNFFSIDDACSVFCFRCVKLPHLFVTY
ncbi:hypothetical protein GW17_00002161, partial [Ensete ventricosum]